MNTISPERLQGQLIGTNLLLEAMLKTLPSVVLKQVFQQYAKNFEETHTNLLATQASDATLDALKADHEARDARLRELMHQARFRDAAAGKLGNPP